MPWGSFHLPTLLDLGVTGSWLPSPGAMMALGGSLLVAAALIFVFLHLLRVAIYLGMAGVILTVVASAGFGYEAQGEAKIMPQVVALQKVVDDANARAAQFQRDAVAASARADALAKSRRAAIVAAVAPLRAQINAQAAAIRNLSIPAAAGELLNPAINAINTANSAAVGAADGAAPTAATVAGATTLGAVEGWAGQVVEQYGECVSQVKGLQQWAGDIVKAAAAQATAAGAHT